MYKTPMMMILIISTTLLCVSSNTWILLWTMLEMNTLAFSSWSTKKAKMSSETTMKYAIIQISSSAIILMTAIYSESTNKLSSNTSTIFLLTGCMKMGASPLHSWFTNMSKTSGWNEFMVLATIQKIPPILILAMTKIKTTEMIIISTTTIPAVAQMNSKTAKEMLTSSSVFNSSWLISSTILSAKTMAIMTLTYMTSMIPMTDMSSKTQKVKNQENNPSKWEKLLISMNMAGMPPTMNFMGKMCVIKSMSTKNMNPLATTMISTSTVNLLMYLQASSSSILSSKKSKKNKLEEKKKLPIATAIPIMLMMVSGQNKGLDSTQTSKSK